MQQNNDQYLELEGQLFLKCVTLLTVQRLQLVKHTLENRSACNSLQFESYTNIGKIINLGGSQLFLKTIPRSQGELSSSGPFIQ